MYLLFVVDKVTTVFDAQEYDLTVMLWYKYQRLVFSVLFPFSSRRQSTLKYVFSPTHVMDTGVPLYPQSEQVDHDAKMTGLCHGFGLLFPSITAHLGPLLSFSKSSFCLFEHVYAVGGMKTLVPDRLDELSTEEQ